MVEPTKHVRQLAPYKITPQDVWSEYASDEILKLDWNECPVDFTFYQDELRKLSHTRGMVAWYPDYLAIKLTQEISKFVGVRENLILTFPGSDVALETICRAYIEQNEGVVVVTPTYENFYTFALQAGAILYKYDLCPPFDFDTNEFINYIQNHHSVKIVYLVSPNNPCGYGIELHEIEKLVESFPKILFIIDEAYIEFSNFRSAVKLVDRYSNIAITRTFSKAFGMAGLRLGYLCAPLEIINTINKIRNGKNIAMIAQALGVKAMQNIDIIEAWIDSVKEARDIFQAWCRQRSIEYYPSQGNFVLFKIRNPNEVFSQLKAAGIYVRNRNEVVPGCLRLTIGSKEHVTKVISALSYLREYL